MGMAENDDKKKCEKEVQTWLGDVGMPYHHYENLLAYHKTLLHNSICQPTKPISPQQRRELFRALCLPEAGRDYVDPVDSKTDEELRTFFSCRNHLQGVLVDWGSD